jgi:FAD/FMN-containing dehydrogenase
VVFFESEEAALDAVDRWRETPGLRMLEYLDDKSLRMMDVAHAAALMIELEGDADLDMSGTLENDSWFATSATDRERLRAFRHTLPERVNARIRRSGFMKLSTDYAVPSDKNREILTTYKEKLHRAVGDNFVIFGHIGDAHLHINTFSDSPEHFAAAKAVTTELAKDAVALGGTVGAEHGLGKRKAHLLEIQYLPAEIEAMRAIKRRFDPGWILGQGTLLSPS